MNNTIIQKVKVYQASSQAQAKPKLQAKAQASPPITVPLLLVGSVEQPGEQAAETAVVAGDGRFLCAGESVALVERVLVVDPRERQVGAVAQVAEYVLQQLCTAAKRHQAMLHCGQNYNKI